MTIKLSKETRKKLVESIRQYLSEECEIEVGDLKGSRVLDFCLQEICPSVYNQAISDAQSYLNEKLLDLGDTYYEPEFNYWKK